MGKSDNSLPVLSDRRSSSLSICLNSWAESKDKLGSLIGRYFV